MKFKIRILAVSILAFGLNTMVLAKPILVKSYKNIEEYKLDNDLQVILYENQKDNKVFMNTIYFTGSLNDPKGKGGLAHLLEHLAFKGTTKVPEKKFQQQLEQYTLTNNASTDYYVTQYTNEISSDIKAIKEVIRLEADRMDGLVLQQKYVPTEIEIVKRERELTSDRSFNILMDEVFRAIYGNESLGREPIGDLDDIQSIKINELNQFYKTWYAPNNAAVVITGNFNKDQILAELDKQFGAKAKKIIPAQAYVKPLNLKIAQQKNIIVKKGSNYQKVNFYMAPRDIVIEPTLEVTPLLHVLEPSGHLFQSMVDTGIVDDINLSPWTTRDFNMMLVTADYVPSQNVKKIENALINGIERSKPFDEKELKRVQNIFKKNIDSDFKDASSLGDVLSESIAINKGDWIQYFKQKDDIQKLNVGELNQKVKEFFDSKNRLNTTIEPTDISKNAIGVSAEHNQTLVKDVETTNTFKNISIYRKDVVEASKKIKQALSDTDQDIKFGALTNGAKYAIYPTETLDDQSFANIVIKFGDSESMLNKKQVIDFTSYLMMRGSKKYDLQDITDKAIEANGDIIAIPELNTIEIRVSADKEYFEDYLSFVLDLIQQPAFDEQQFNLMKTRALNRLDKSYTEPDAVTKLNMDYLTNHYSVGDLRYKETPEQEKQRIKDLNLKQIKEFYQKYIKANHANIIVTGEVETKKIEKLLSSHLATWSGSEQYALIENTYVPIKAQNVYLKAEPREFGHYKAYMNIPLSIESDDFAAMWVLSYILGESQMSSRLGQELREKNALVYGFSESLDLNQKTEAGSINIETSYTAGKSNLVSQAVKKVFNDLLEKGVTDQEVEAAKSELLKQIATSLENPATVHVNLVMQLKFNRDTKSVQKKYQQVAQLNQQQVNAAIRKYIDMKQFVEVMADQFAKEESKIK